MNKPGKIGIGIIACLLGVLILMLAAILIAPKLIDSEAVKAKVRSEIKETAGVEIDFKHLVLDFFPHPHVIFDQVTLSIPQVVRGKAVSLRVYPTILPLFLGNVKIAGLRLDSAELDYTVTKKPATEQISSQPFSLYELGKKIQSFVSRLPEFKIPGLDFQVINSKVNLFDSGRKIMALRSVNSHLEGPPAGRKMTLNCKSNLWQRISMSGLLNTRTFKGSGQVQFTQFRPQGLAAYLSPDSPIRITDAPANLTIDFKTDEPGQLQAELYGSSPYLKIRYAKEALNIKNPRIKAAFQVDKDSFTLSLTELAMDYPRLQLSATLDEHQISIESANLAWNNIQVNMSGSMKPHSQNRLWLDLDITADTVNLDHLIQALKYSSDNNGPKTAPFLPVKGSIRFKADRFKIGKFTWNPLHADISLNNDTADITLKEAVICGISTPGTLKVSPPNIEFDLEAVAKDHELNPTRQCFVGETFKADGTYNLKGRFQGSGKAEDLLKTATGQVEFTAKDGHVYHDIILVNVLKFLNTLEELTGKVNFKDMEKKGFGYHSFRVKAKLQDGKLRYEEAVLHGLPMTVTAAGEHNLQNGRFDLILLVAPLVTLDRIFEHIPLTGGIPGTLDAIPLSAKGTLDNIHIYPLAPSAVGYELEEMMKKTIERPINLIHGVKATEKN